MVVTSHLSGSPGFVSLTPFIGNILGETGVRIFFVLSGFLITSLLVSEHNKTGAINLRHFYVRRCFRIFPAFYFYLLVLVLAFGCGWITLMRGDLVKASLYVVDYCRWDSTSNFVRHIWSLSVEEQFYLVWPVAMWALGPRRAKWIATASIVMSPIWRLVITALVPTAVTTLDRRFDAISDSLATGCLLACLHAGLFRLVKYRALLASKWLYALPLVALGAGALGEHPRIDRLFGYSVANLAIALFLHRCILLPPQWLNTQMIQRIGVMSYSIYLWQQAWCSPHEGLPRFPVYLSVPGTLLVSWGSYVLIEGPLQRMGRRLTAKEQQVRMEP